MWAGSQPIDGHSYVQAHRTPHSIYAALIALRTELMTRLYERTPYLTYTRLCSQRDRPHASRRPHSHMRLDDGPRDYNTTTTGPVPRRLGTRRTTGTSSDTAQLNSTIRPSSTPNPHLDLAWSLSVHLVISSIAGSPTRLMPDYQGGLGGGPLLTSESRCFIAPADERASYCRT